MSVNSKMTAIADNIRSKTGKTELLNLDDIASGVSEVYEVGKKSFWNTYLKRMREGKSVSYLFAGESWNSETFYPPEDLIIKGVSNGIFYYFSWWIAPYIDLAQRLEECGVVLDTSQCTSFSLSFANCFVTRLPKIDVSSVTNLDRTFQGDRVLETIDELALKDDGTNTFSNTFQNNISLSNIKTSGVMGRSVSFADSPLTVESIKSIITHLKNYGGTEDAGKYTLTLKDSCKTLMAEQGEIEELGGKTYDAYIADIGWNLA